MTGSKTHKGVFRCLVVQGCWLRHHACFELSELSAFSKWNHGFSSVFSRQYEMHLDRLVRRLPSEHTSPQHLSLEKTRWHLYFSPCPVAHAPACAISRGKRSFEGKICILLKTALEEAASHVAMQLQVWGQWVWNSLWDARENFAHSHIPIFPGDGAAGLSELNLRYLKYSCI